MANTPQAKKRVRQAEKKRRHNASSRSMISTLIKRTVKAIDAGVLEIAQTAYQKMVPVLDRMATKGLIAANKSARHKSRLLVRLRKLNADSAIQKIVA